MLGRSGAALGWRVHGEQGLAGEEEEAAVMCWREEPTWAFYRPGMEKDEYEEVFKDEIGRG